MVKMKWIWEIERAWNAGLAGLRWVNYKKKSLQENYSWAKSWLYTFSSILFAYTHEPSGKDLKHWFLSIIFIH